MEDGVPSKIAYACSYVPAEIIMAAGLSPVRIVPRGNPPEGDGLIHPNTCCYARSMLAHLLEENLTGVRGMIFANSCDGMRKLFDIWEQTGRQPVPIFLDIPKKADRDSISYFSSELKRLAQKLEEGFSDPCMTEARLRDAIRECNRLRSVVNGVLSSSAEPGSSIRSSEVFRMLLEEESTGIENRAERIRESASHTSGTGRTFRIVLTGNALALPEVVSMIEGFRVQIVSFDICFGHRHYQSRVREDAADPIAAVAERYLLRPPCPRMEGIASQADYLKELAQATSADGVIISHVRYCDHWIYSIPLFRAGLRQAGIPVLVLENDYLWSDLEKTRIKIEAFLEIVAQGRTL